jgi:cytochrome c2
MRRISILLILVLCCGGCVSGVPLVGAPMPTAITLTGDPEHGESIFRRGVNGAPPCIGCHALAPGGFGLGPVLRGIQQRAAARIEGVTSEAYIRDSILNPAGYIVPGYRDLMYAHYRDHFSDQDLADLIAFLISLSP